MHTSEGLELESETSPVGRFWFLYWRPAQLQGVRVRGVGLQTGLAGTYYGIRRISRVQCLLCSAPPQYKRGRRMYGFRHLNITISKESREGNH